MSRIWLFMLCLVLLAPVSVPSEQGAFDNWSCQQECEFRFGIKRDAWGGGAVMLPSDTPRRLAYLECVEACNKRSWPSFGDQTR